MTTRTDTFDRADSTSSLGTPSDGGSAWTALSGTWGISSNQAYTSAAISDSLAVLDSGSADTTVGVTVATNGSNPGLIWRASDVNNLFLWTRSAVVYRKQSGSYVSLGTRSSFTSGDVLEVDLSGSTFTGWKNGVSWGADITSTFNQTATKHGLRSDNNTGNRFDDFSVTDAGGSAVVSSFAGRIGGAQAASGTKSAAMGMGARIGVTRAVAAQKGVVLGIAATAGSAVASGVRKAAQAAIAAAAGVLGSLSQGASAPSGGLAGQGGVRGAISAATARISGFAGASGAAASNVARTARTAALAALAGIRGALGGINSLTAGTVLSATVSDAALYSCAVSARSAYVCTLADEALYGCTLSEAIVS